MSTIYDNSSSPARGARALALLPDPQPWYATAPTSADERREELADAYTRILAGGRLTQHGPRGSFSIQRWIPRS
jgi:hypothetical protein